MKKSLSLALVAMLVSSNVLPVVARAETTVTSQSELESSSSIIEDTLGTAKFEEVLTTSEAAPVTQDSTVITEESSLIESSENELNEMSEASQTTKTALPDLVTGIYSDELAAQYQTNPEVQAMLEALTPEDLATSVGEDGTGSRAQSKLAAQEAADTIARTATILGKYQNVNSYIAQQKFANPKISKDSRFNTLPQNDYSNYRPIGVVVHETANDYSSITSEVNFMYRNYYNAFVHAFVDNGQVIETAPTEYKAWGAGQMANPFYIHIELVRESSFHNFAKSVSNDAYWIALQLYQWGLTPSFADNNGGKGSVISHNAISKYLGGTNHVDPVTYFAKWGYNMDQFYALVQSKYNTIKANDKRKATIKKRENFKYELIVASEAYNLYTNPYNTPGATALKKISAIAKKGDKIKVKEAIETSGGTKVYALENGLYVDQKALKAAVTVVEEKIMDKVMSLNDRSYYLYNLPPNTLGAVKQQKLSAVYYNRQQVKIVAAVKTSDNGQFYKLSNGQYVDQRAFVNLATIKTQTDFSPAKRLRVTQTTCYLYSQPYNTLGMEQIGRLNDKLPANSVAEVTKEVITSAGTKNYYIKNVGWISPNALGEFRTFTEDTNFKPRNMRLKSVSYGIYKAPYQTENAILLGTIKSKYKLNAQVYVTRYATTSTGGKTYYIENVGWVDYRALKEIAILNEQTSFKARNMRIKSISYGIYSAPYNTENVLLKATVKSKYKVNDQVHVTRYGTTNEGVKTYYIENVGWVDYRVLKEVAVFTESTSFKPHNMRIKSISYGIYSAPYNTDNAVLNGTMKAKFSLNQSVKVTKYGTSNQGLKTYYIDKIGWVDARTIVEFKTYKAQSINKKMKIASTGYYFYNVPYGTEGFKQGKQIKTQYKKNQTVNVTKYTETSSGLKTYYISGKGWVDARALK